VSCGITSPTGACAAIQNSTQQVTNLSPTGMGAGDPHPFADRPSVRNKGPGPTRFGNSV
jgi:hypothetical protein